MPKKKLTIALAEDPAPVSESSADTPQTFNPAVMAAQAFGLDPNGSLCATKEAFVLRPAGLVSLARRSGKILHVECRVTREKDTFALDYGRYILSHAPYTNAGDLGAISGAYAILVLVDGYRVIQHDRAEDLLEGTHEDDPEAQACGSAEELLRRRVMIRAFKQVPFDMPDLFMALEAERQSLNGEPITALPPH